MMRPIRTCILALVVFAFAVPPPMADASYFGTNGKISYDVYTGPEPTPISRPSH